MSLTTCAVLCSVFDDAGAPVSGAVITAKLNRFEVYQGFIVPTLVQGTTDATGTCTLALWPNALGSTESLYAIKIQSPIGKSLSSYAAVPNVTNANLHEITEVPAYPGKTDGQLILTEAVTAGATAVAAASAASASATASAGSQTASAASAVTASSASTSAGIYSANASGFASAASASADAAATSATGAAGSATTATTKAGESAASAVTSAASAVTSTTKAGESASSASSATAQAVIATTQAGNSSTSATASAGSATASAASAVSSEASRVAAALSAASASGSATSAGTSSAAASGSASTASTKATEAAGSATASAGSAVTAASQATIATTQAGYASTSEANALIYSVTATNKAAAALVSASASADSANSSAASATASAGSAASALSTYTSTVAVYGSITAVNTAVTNSAASATAAAASAASALSIYGSMSAVSAAVSAASSSATAAAGSATAAAASAVTAAGYTVPSQTGNAGKALFTNGSAVSWQSGTGTGTSWSIGDGGVGNGTLTLCGNPTANGSGYVKFINSNTLKSWQIAFNGAIAGALEFTRSTATGGSTFTTPDMLLDSNGLLGLGTSSPGYKLDVQAPTAYVAAFTTTLATTYASIKLVGNSRGGELDFFNGSTLLASIVGDTNNNIAFYNGTGQTERMRMDSSGNFAIGKTPGNERLGVKLANDTNFAYGLNVARNANDSFFGIGYNTTADAWQLGAHYQSTGAYKPVTFWTSSSERMRINANGLVGIGKTSTGGALEVQLPNDGNYSYGINVFRLANDSQFGIGYNSSADAWSLTASFGSTGAYKPIAFSVNSAERVRFDTSGNILVGKTSATANAGDVQISKGIAFPATQVSCSDANTLDDYEEGTWTPVVYGITSAGAGTYSAQAGVYTKIGNLVTVQLYLNVTAHTGTGTMAISGFPFAAASGYIHPVVIPWVNNLAMSAGNVPCSYLNAGGTSIVMSQMPSGGGAVTALPMDSAFELMLTASYRV